MSRQYDFSCVTEEAFQNALIQARINAQKNMFISLRNFIRWHIIFKKFLDSCVGKSKFEILERTFLLDQLYETYPFFKKDNFDSTIAYVKLCNLCSLP